MSTTTCADGVPIVRVTDPVTDTADLVRVRGIDPERAPTPQARPAHRSSGSLWSRSPTPRGRALQTFGLPVLSVVNEVIDRRTTWAVPRDDDVDQVARRRDLLRAGLHLEAERVALNPPGARGEPGSGLRHGDNTDRGEPGVRRLRRGQTTGSAPTGCVALQVARARPGPVAEAVAVQRRPVEALERDGARQRASVGAVGLLGEARRVGHRRRGRPWSRAGCRRG